MFPNHDGRVASTLEAPINRLVLAVVLIVAAPFPSGAQSVPEGVHRLADGPAAMCGIVGADASDLLATARQSADLRAVPIASDRFEMFEGGDPVRYQLVATLPREPAYPAVTCRELYEEGGALRMKRSMRCDAERADCDALFREFQALDAEFTRAMQGGSR